MADESKQDDGVHSIIQASLEPVYQEYHHQRGNISYLIHYESNRFVVFIDAEKELDWETSDAIDEELLNRDGPFHHIVADVDLLSHQVGVRFFLPETQRAFLWHLGRALVLAMDGQEALARRMVTFAAKFYSARLLEHCRKCQHTCSFVIYFISLLMFTCFYNLGDYLSYDVRTVGFTVFYGCTGVMLYGIHNIAKMRYSSGAGWCLHLLQILSRYVAGSIGAYFLTLLFKAGFVFQSFQGEGNEGAMLAILGVVGGFSAKMVPSILERFTVEGEISDEARCAPNRQSGR